MRDRAAFARGGRREAGVTHDVGRVEHAGVVDAHPAVQPGRRAAHRDLRVPALRVDEAEERGGREVAEHRAGPARLERGQIPPLERQAGVAHRIDPAMDPMQPAVADPRGDGVAREPACPQLVEGEHAPLTGRPPGDQHVGLRVDFGALSAIKSTSGARSA
jgi:hypothetical protein